MPRLTPKPPSRPQRYFMRSPVVAQTIGVSMSQLYNMINDGEFPPLVKLGKRASGQDSDVVFDWLDAKLATADMDVGYDRPDAKLATADTA